MSYYRAQYQSATLRKQEVQWLLELVIGVKEASTSCKTSLTLIVGDFPISFAQHCHLGLTDLMVLKRCNKRATKTNSSNLINISPKKYLQVNCSVWGSVDGWRSYMHTHPPFFCCDGGMLKSRGTSEDSSSLCSIIHHLWLQNSLGSLWGYTLYPDGKTRAPLSPCLLRGPGPLVHRSTQGVPSLPCSHQSHQKEIKNALVQAICKSHVHWKRLPKSKRGVWQRLAASLNPPTEITKRERCNLFLFYFPIIINLYICDVSPNAHLYQHK